MADEITNYYEELEIGALTYILFLLNAEIDNGDKWRGITFDEVYSHLEAVSFKDRLQQADQGGATWTLKSYQQ